MNNRIINGEFNGFDNENCLKDWFVAQRDMSFLPFAQSLDANNGLIT